MRVRVQPAFWRIVSVCLLAAQPQDGQAAERKSVTLSRHETVAEFQGTSDHRCLGLTSLCPDRCGHSGTLASFRIVKYLTYAKLGEYGDPQCEHFDFLIEDNLKQLKVPAAIHSAVSSLKPGSGVLFAWNHDYVTVDGSSAPERPVTQLEQIAVIGTAAWLNQIERCARVRDAAGHGPAIDSAEWRQAVSVKTGVYDALGHGPTPDSEEWRIALHRKAFGFEPATSRVAVYRSATRKELRVTYNNLQQTVTLHTSGKEITLPQALSASGARYAAGDEEFWNKGSTVVYRKGGTLLFEGSE